MMWIIIQILLVSILADAKLPSLGVPAFDSKVASTSPTGNEQRVVKAFMNSHKFQSVQRIPWDVDGIEDPEEAACRQTEIEALRLFQQGKIKYNRLEFVEASNYFQSAIVAFQRAFPCITDNTLALQAYLKLGLAYLAQNQTTHAEETLSWVVRLNPDFRVSENQASPQNVSFFNHVRDRLLRESKSEMKFKGIPKGARITLNGRRIPNDIRTVIPGKQWIRVEADDHRPWVREMMLAPGGRYEVVVSLESKEDMTKAYFYPIPNPQQVSNHRIQFFLNVCAKNRVDMMLLLKQTQSDRGKQLTTVQLFDCRRRVFSRAVTKIIDVGERGWSDLSETIGICIDDKGVVDPTCSQQ